MKTMLLAAAAVLSLSVGAAFAESEGGPAANTQFASIHGYLAEAAAQQTPSVATAQSGQVTHSYVANSNRGTWLFAPSDGGGANN